MRQWRSCLPPLLTVLTVACLTVLPPWLSQVRDRSLAGVVCPEELGTDSNFPARPPRLERRLLLLAQALEKPADLAVVQQEMEAAAQTQEKMKALVREELQHLGELEIVPKETEEFQGFQISCLYLRDPRDLAGARFLQVQSYQTGPVSYDSSINFSVILDSETGRALGMRLFGIRKGARDPETLGQAFLKRLGLTGELMDSDGVYGGYCYLRVPDSGTVYRVVLEQTSLEILPQPDWTAEEPGAVSGEA